MLISICSSGKVLAPPDASILTYLMMLEIRTTTMELIDIAADDIIGDIVTPNE